MMDARQAELQGAHERLTKAIFDVLLADPAFLYLTVADVRHRAFDAASAATAPDKSTAI